MLDFKDKDVEEDVALDWYPGLASHGQQRASKAWLARHPGVSGKIWTAFASLGPCGSLTRSGSQIFCNKEVLTPTSQYG